MHGLVALMEIQASRMPARLGAAGLPVPLLEQNRGRWDQLLIRRGFTALLRAQRLGGPPGPYVLQAAIAACHARARTAAETDWRQIAALYRGWPRSPHPRWSSSTARSPSRWPTARAAACASSTALAGEPALRRLPPLPSVRGDLLARLGRHAEAAGEFRRAAALTRNAAERTALEKSAARCDGQAAL